MAKAWEGFKEDLRLQSQFWPKVQYVGKDGDRMVDYPVVPMTLEGFYRFCRIHYGEVRQYFLNQDGLYDDFITICRAIKDEIREHQIIGGMLGFYNPSITQRLNGLVEKTENDHHHEGTVEITLNLNK